MKILITESQLRLLILSEGPPDINNPDVPEERLYGYAPISPIDFNSTSGNEFMTWLSTNFSDVYMLYAGNTIRNLKGGIMWDTSTIKTIRDSYKKPSYTYASKYSGDVNIGKVWDAYKQYQVNQKRRGQARQEYGYEQIQQQKLQQAQQQQQKQQLQKIANDYQTQQDAKANQFVAKQDVLDPNKIQGASYAQFCQKWTQKNPSKPCPQATEAESAFASGNWETYIDWFITIMEYLFPQFKFINTLREIGMAIYNFYLAFNAKTIVDAVTNFLTGLSWTSAAIGKKIQLPNWLKNFIAKIEKVFEKSNLNKIITKISGTGKRINANFTESPMWVQILVMVVVDIAGDFISWVIDTMVGYILNPIYTYINQWAPKIAGYIKTGMDWLSIIRGMIDDGKKLKEDSEIEKIYKEVKGLILGN